MDTTSSLSTLIESNLADLSSKQAQVTTAYDYEKTFAEWWSALGKEVFQARLQEEQASNEPKKTFDPLWPHPSWSTPPNESSTSGL